MKSDIFEIIKKIDKLKPMSSVVNKILELTGRPESSMTEIADVIKSDPALTANILRICNSAYFNLPQKIESIHQAIVFIGFDQVIDMVLINGATANLMHPQNGYDLISGELWKNAVISANIARDLANRIALNNIQTIYTAALLKDIGKVVLSQFVSAEFEKIMEKVAAEKIPFDQAEKEILGIDHAALGGMIAGKWNFSEKMVRMIENHHLPLTDSPHDPETSVIYLADSISMMLGIGVGADGLAYQFHEDVIEMLELDEKMIDTIIVGSMDQIQHIENLIGIH